MVWALELGGLAVTVYAWAILVRLVRGKPGRDNGRMVSARLVALAGAWIPYLVVVIVVGIVINELR